MNALRAFAAVYMSGGIRPAGRLLGVSHSSVARHVSDLEAKLGTPLLEKGDGTNALRFSAAGEALGNEAARTFETLQHVWSSAKERKGRGAVTLSTAPSVAALWLLPRLPSLADSMPAIELSVLAEQRVRAPSDDGCDLAIRMGGTVGENSETLMDDALAPVIAPRLLLRAHTARGGPTGDANTANLLRDLPLVHDRDPNAGWAQWLAANEITGVDVSSGPRFTSSDLVLRAAKLGQGIALARLRLAKADILDGSLERLPCASLPLPNAYNLVFDPERLKRSAVRAVRDWLHTEASRDLLLSDGG